MPGEKNRFLCASDRSARRCNRGVGSLASAALVLCSIALAGEPQAAVPGGKYELLPMGKRDPFTIWKPQVVAPKTLNPVASPLNVEPEITPKFTTSGGVVSRPSGTASPSRNPDVPLRKARNALDNAYHFLLIGAYEAAVSSTEEAMREIEDLDVERAGRLQEEAMRINKAARKLKFRKDVEAEFGNLPIKIQGIVWKPERSFAVINGKIVREGKVIEGARVYKILPREVIFVYKGLKVSKKLFEGGQGNAPSPKRTNRRSQR